VAAEVQCAVAAEQRQQLTAARAQAFERSLVVGARALELARQLLLAARPQARCVDPVGFRAHLAHEALDSAA